MEKNGYVYPDPVTRRRAVAVVILAGIGVLALGLGAQFVLRPWVDAYFAGLDELAKRDPVAASQKLLRLVSVVMAANGGVLAAAGLYLCLAGRQTGKAERWPYPGMKIRRRWKILDGRSARRRGRLLFALGLLLVVLGPTLAWKAYSVVSATLSPAKPNSGLQPPAQNAAAES